MSGRGGMDDVPRPSFGGKAGKGAVKRRKKEKGAYESDLDEDLEDAYASGLDGVQRHCGGAAAAGPPAPAAGGAATAGPPAPAAATRQTERTARDSEHLIRVLRADKQRLTSIDEDNRQTIKELREQLAAANAEKDNSQAGQQDLAARLAEATDQLRCYRGIPQQLSKCSADDLEKVRQGLFTTVDAIMYEQYMRSAEKAQREYQEKKGLPDITECNICSNGFEDPVVTHCKHTFCKSCLTEWLNRSKTCPACRADIHHILDTTNLQTAKEKRDLQIQAAVGKLLQAKDLSYERLSKRVRSWTTIPGL